MGQRASLKCGPPRSSHQRPIVTTAQLDKARMSNAAATQRIVDIIRVNDGRLVLQDTTKPNATVDAWLCFTHDRQKDIWRCQEHSVILDRNGKPKLTQHVNTYCVNMQQSCHDGEVWLVSTLNNAQLRLTMDSDMLLSAPRNSIQVFYYTYGAMDLKTRFAVLGRSRSRRAKANSSI
eukprot:TRINITY_DN1877_c0_g1_i1.p1 TRINITY_DN1877_c0_g1~~TRINITY_DN1877_c0_g1_i1.p1  ORF type:complete len:177 (+),score=20.51 TRINITY_DN1877_c0_g1_i1:101-631(+)